MKLVWVSQEMTKDDKTKARLQDRGPNYVCKIKTRPRPTWNFQQTLESEPPRAMPLYSNHVPRALSAFLYDLEVGRHYV